MSKQHWTERYWAKVDMRGPDECWLWQASTDTWGYGRLRANGRLIGAHRLAWELINGPIPEGQWVCHHCDTPACCNPAHLFLGTAINNARDRQEKGRSAIMCLRGPKNGNSKLTQKEVRQIRKLYATGEYTQDKLGQQFGIGQRHIGDIVNRRQWAWLD